MICCEKAFLLTSKDGKRTMKTEAESLNFTQEETDSRVILYCFYAKGQGYRYVRVKRALTLTSSLFVYTMLRRWMETDNF